MQTFLPYWSFNRSARCLDYKRLGKQRVECKQILIALGQPVGGSPGAERSAWRNHPAVRMWQGYEWSLTQYAIEICLEWRNRGYADALAEEFRTLARALGTGNRNEPEWLGRDDFHASHRSNLLRKDATWYGQFGWTEPDSLPYAWPVELLSQKSKKIFS